MNGMTYGDNILSGLHKTLEMALKYGETEDADIEKYKEMAKIICKIEHGFVLGHTIVKDAAKEASIETFDQNLLDHQQESHPNFKPQASKRYMDFVKKAQRLVDVENADSSQNSDIQTMDVDDLTQTEQLIPDIDPITKKKLERPVRNKQCGHIYGFDTVLKSLQQSSRLRCPHVGCAYKGFITMDDLIEDEDLAVRLARQRQSQR